MVGGEPMAYPPGPGEGAPLRAQSCRQAFSVSSKTSILYPWVTSSAYSVIGDEDVMAEFSVSEPCSVPYSAAAPAVRASDSPAERRDGTA